MNIILTRASGRLQESSHVGCQCWY